MSQFLEQTRLKRVAYLVVAVAVAVAMSVVVLVAAFDVKIPSRPRTRGPTVAAAAAVVVVVGAAVLIERGVEGTNGHCSRPTARMKSGRVKARLLWRPWSSQRERVGG